MMKKIAQKSALLALIAGLGVGVSTAQAQERVYWAAPTAATNVVKSGFGLCWRAGYWTPAAAAKDAAGCECDKDLLPKETCGPKVTPPPPPPKDTTCVVGEKVTLNADSLFDFNKATLRPEGKAALDKAVAGLKGLTLQVILVVGHTDRIGKEDYNQKLSDKRAAAVKEYLVAKGIEPNRVYTEGKGKKWPTPATEKCTKMGAENGGNKKLVACLQPDRRVETEIIGNKPCPPAMKK